MELHLLSGNTNRLFDALSEYLKKIDSFDAEEWNMAPGFQRPKLHGGQFKGGQCSKLLENVSVLEEKLKENNLGDDEFLLSIISAFKCLKEVNKSCMGNHLDKDYEQKLKNYACAY